MALTNQEKQREFRARQKAAVAAVPVLKEENQALREERDALQRRVIELEIKLATAEASHAEFRGLVERDYQARMATMAEDDALIDPDREAAHWRKVAKNAGAARRLASNSAKRRALEKAPPPRA